MRYYGCNNLSYIVQVSSVTLRFIYLALSMQEIWTTWPGAVVIISHIFGGRHFTTCQGLLPESHLCSLVWLTYGKLKVINWDKSIWCSSKVLLRALLKAYLVNHLPPVNKNSGLRAPPCLERYKCLCQPHKMTCFPQIYLYTFPDLASFWLFYIDMYKWQRCSVVWGNIWTIRNPLEDQRD